MENYLTLKTEVNGEIITLWLNRPEVHNALNDNMIHEITSFFTQIEYNDSIRVVIIRGHGKSFCSGADLAWMKRSFTLNEVQNLKESHELSSMFNLIFKSSKVVTRETISKSN